jgi:hypothetical protein
MGGAMMRTDERQQQSTDKAKAEVMSAVPAPKSVEVDVPASTAQQDALEHYGWAPPTRRSITLPN